VTVAVSLPAPSLRLRDAVALTVGIVLGAGIFRTPSVVAGGVSGEAMLIAVWAAGALIALVGALCYAELASAYPSAGGDYHFLGRAFGRRFALLYAWARLSVIQTGSIVVLAYVFGDYAARLLLLGPSSSAIYAALAVSAITAVNWLGVRQGVLTHNLLSILEVCGLAAVIVAGLLIAPPAVDTGAASTPTTSLGLVMVFVLLTYGGWSEAAFVSAELKGGAQRMVAVLVISLAVIAALYLMVNLAYLTALGLAGMAASEAVASDVMAAAFGPAGLVAIAIVVAIAALTSANATAVTGARSAWALGRDVGALRWLGRWDGGHGVPRNAILVQGALALLLVGLASLTRSGFQTAVEYTAPVFWFFFMMTGIALFVLRRREPSVPRPFRVPLYPVLPGLFIGTNAALLWSSLVYTGWGALVGVGVLLAGSWLLFVSLSPPQEE
jgi:basic amino acid/polyamine antiporter, APA family